MNMDDQGDRKEDPKDGEEGVIWTEEQREAVFRDFPANLIPDHGAPLPSTTYRGCKLFDSDPPPQFPDDDEPVYRSFGGAVPHHAALGGLSAQDFANSLGATKDYGMKAGPRDFDDLRAMKAGPRDFDDLGVQTLRPPVLTSMAMDSAARDFDATAYTYGIDGGVATIPKPPMPGNDLTGPLVFPGKETPTSSKEPPYLTDCPYFLQPYTHCYFKGASEMLQHLSSKMTAVLEEKNVDIEYNAEKFKWSGRAYAYNRSLDMRVRIFSLRNPMSNGDNYVLEFQRLQGCAMQFAYLYQCCLAAVVREISISFHDDTGKGKNFKEPEHDGSPKVIDMGYSQNLELEAFKPLVSMTKSEFIDIKRQAVREIANQLAKAIPRGLLVKSKELGDELLGLVMSKDREQLRCALSGLANIIEDQNDVLVFQKTCGDMGPQIYTAIAHIAQSLDQETDEHMEVELETRRHCLRILVTLVRYEEFQCMGGKEGAKRLFLELSKLRAMKDRRFKGFVDDGRKALNMA